MPLWRPYILQGALLTIGHGPLTLVMWFITLPTGATCTWNACLVYAAALPCYFCLASVLDTHLAPAAHTPDCSCSGSSASSA